MGFGISMEIATVTGILAFQCFQRSIARIFLILLAIGHLNVYTLKSIDDGAVNPNRALVRHEPQKHS